VDFLERPEKGPKVVHETLPLVGWVGIAKNRLGRH
jgi:hypothetical protein